MKKYLVSFLVLVAFGLYLAFSNQSSTTTTGTTPIAVTGTPTSTFKNPDIGNINPGGTNSGGPSAGGTTDTGTAGGSGTTVASGAYKDGAYTGNVADAIFGPLQVAVTVQGGELTNVTFPQYPNDSGHTREVSTMALPILRQEAITAQSANVNVVSGATQTSEAFMQSLGDALAQAKA